MIAIFFLISFFYSMVGLGGGSSYVAILALMDTPYDQIPFISLVCNLIVVGSGSFHYLRGGYFRFKLFFPIIVGSIPMAFIGGTIPIDKQFFLFILGLTLILMSLRLFWDNQWKKNDKEIRKSQPVLGVLIGSCLGILSGLLGIGGGIFLSPILLLLRWGTPKEVASTASIFVFLNSLSGLLGHLLRHPQHFILSEYWPVFVVVFIGGQLGSILSTKKISQNAVGSLTAILVLFVGCRTLLKFWVSTQ